MKIVYLEISGFKLHKAKRSFDFGQINHISGGNGKGKTTIAEAITWCFYGCDLAGNTKGIFERLKNPSAKETKVIVGVELTKDGVSARFNFCRTRKGKTTELFINGREAKQVHFDGLIGRMELFLSVFVPGYFGNMAALEPTKARTLLVSMMPELQHDTVIAKLNEEDQVRIEKLDMINPEATLRNLRSEIKDLDTALENTQGKIEYLRVNSMLDIPMKVFEEDDRKLEALKTELAELMEGGSQPFQHNLQPLQEKKAQLRARYDERKAEFLRIKSLPLPQVGDQCPECGHAYSADEAVAELDKRREKLVSIQQECEALKDEGHALNEEIMRLNSENTNFIAEFYKEKGKKMQALQADIERLQSLQSERKTKLKMAEDLSLQYKIYDETVAERDEKLADMQAVRNFMLMYAEMQVEFVNSYLNKAEIRLFKYAQSTGEMTLDFTILYNDTEYKSLSTSEKIRCSIELSELLNRVRGIAYPVYIDNAESVEEFDAPKSQYFVATVVKRTALKTDVVA